ncbi:MAG: hypothetical protein J5806_06570 [Lentisphaeria bacterium]|nr:hypothetical protein [Lentisphaeria bacterium]
MKKNIFRPSFFLVILVLIAYILAEIIIRGNALNQISRGIGGWLFWGGIVLLIYCWFILPILRFVTFPQWVDLGSFTDPRDEMRYLKKMGKYYVKAFGQNCPYEISELISKLKKTLNNPKLNFYDFRDNLRQIVPEIHRQLSEVICDRIIKDYMKKTAILVCISQHGWLDSGAMLVMQLRLIVDLSRSFGYRPSWIFILYCFGWIMVNSIAFALFDGTEIIEDAMQELLPLTLGESLGKSLPLGKVFGIAMQGVSAMAIVYATGKIIQRKLMGSKARLTVKERVQYRVDGYHTAVRMLVNK